MDSVTSYAKKVVAGKIIAGDSVKKACKRHLKDLKKSKRKDFRKNNKISIKQYKCNTCSRITTQIILSK